jgi:hypothetical protein
MPSQPSKSDYKVAKISEAYAKVAPNKGGNSDVRMKVPGPVGGQRNSAAQADLAGELAAEKDLATLIKAAAIRANKARLGAAIEAGERRANVAVKMGRSDGPVGEIKGKNNAGVRTRANSKDNVRLRTGTGGTSAKRDGGVGRW